MEVVKEGVANFRAFQLENRDFMGWFRAQEETRTKTDKRRSRIHFWLLGLLGSLIVALFIYLLNSHDHRVSEILQPHPTHQVDAANPPY